MDSGSEDLRRALANLEDLVRDTRRIADEAARALDQARCPQFGERRRGDRRLDDRRRESDDRSAA